MKFFHTACLLFLVHYCNSQTICFDYDSVLVYCSAEDFEHAIYRDDDKEYAAEKWAELVVPKLKPGQEAFFNIDEAVEFEREIKYLVRNKKASFYDKRSKHPVTHLKRIKERTNSATVIVYLDRDTGNRVYEYATKVRVKF